MNKLISILFSLFIVSFATAQLPNVTVNWSNSWCPLDSMNDIISSTATDIYGNIYTGGYKNSDDTIVNFVSKTSATGQVEWITYVTPALQGCTVLANNRGLIGVGNGSAVTMLDSNGYVLDVYYPGANMESFKVYDDSTFVVETGDLVLHYFVGNHISNTWTVTDTNYDVYQTSQAYLWDSLGHTYKLGNGQRSHYNYYSVSVYNSLGDSIHTFQSDSAYRLSAIDWALAYPNIYVLINNPTNSVNIVTFNAQTCQPLASSAPIVAPWLRFFKLSYGHFTLAGCDTNYRHIRLTGVNAAGNILWADSFSSNPGLYKYYLIATDYDNTGIYLAGVQMAPNDSSLVLLKYDYSGTLLWSQINAFAHTPVVSGVFAHGNTVNTVLNGQDGAEQRNLWFYYLNTFDTSLSHLTSYDLHVVGDVYFTQVVKDAAGNLYCSGKVLRSPRPSQMLLEKLDPHGNVLWMVTDTGQGHSLVIDSINSNVIVVGNNGAVAPQNYVPKIWRYDLNGNLVWKKTYPYAFYSGLYPERGYRLSAQLDHDNNLLTYGLNTEPPANFFLGKYDINGDTLFTMLDLNTLAVFPDFEPQLILEPDGNMLFFDGNINYLDSSGHLIQADDNTLITRVLMAGDEAHLYMYNDFSNACLAYANEANLSASPCLGPFNSGHGNVVTNMFQDPNGYIYFINGGDGLALYLSKVNMNADTIFQITLPYADPGYPNAFMGYDDRHEYYTSGYFDQAGHLVFITNLSPDTVFNNYTLSAYANIRVYVFDTLGNVLFEKTLPNYRPNGPEVYKGSIFDTVTNRLIVAGSAYSEHGVKAGMIYSLTIDEAGLPQATTGVGNPFNFAVLPNPCHDECTLMMTGAKGMLTAAVYDVTGREVNLLFTHQSLSNFYFSTAQMASGLYLIEVTNQLGVKCMQKLVKE